jgi:hypothetical protein
VSAIIWDTFIKVVEVRLLTVRALYNGVSPVAVPAALGSAVPAALDLVAATDKSMVTIADFAARFV